MGERYDELQVQLFRSQGEVLALQTKFDKQNLHKTTVVSSLNVNLIITIIFHYFLNHCLRVMWQLSH